MLLQASQNLPNNIKELVQSMFANMQPFLASHERTNFPRERQAYSIVTAAHKMFAFVKEEKAFIYSK